MKEELLEKLKPCSPDKYPPSGLYSDLLDFITPLFKLTKDEARKRYGQFDGLEWVELLNGLE